MKSEIDGAVLAVRSNTSHIFETVPIEGISVEVCTRCGCRKDQVKVPDKTYDYLPCRGFI